MRFWIFGGDGFDSGFELFIAARQCKCDDDLGLKKPWFSEISLPFREIDGWFQHNASISNVELQNYPSDSQLELAYSWFFQYELVFMLLILFYFILENKCVNLIKCLIRLLNPKFKFHELIPNWWIHSYACISY